MKDALLAKLRDGKPLLTKELLQLIIFLSIPAILSNLSTIVMQYIDASMVGHYSADAAAAIGLMATSTWLLGGLSMAATIGFSVQVAQAIGAKEEVKARQIVRLALVMTLIVSIVHGGLGCLVSGHLPNWLGGDQLLWSAASGYFLIFAASLPLVQINSVCGGLLQASGNMKTPSFLHILMCILDVIFNGLLIFPSWNLSFLGLSIPIPGADLGVWGAALGTALAQLVVSFLMLRALLLKSPQLCLRSNEKLIFSRDLLKKGFKIAVPVALEQLVMTSAQIMSTRIVAPLGLAALAANSFSITIEGLCYMPGFGIGAAATTLIGQSIGAKRDELTRRIAWVTVGLGMVILAVMGALMYSLAPALIASLSPDPEVQRLGATILRIEALCEPLYGAAIVATGVFRGASDTLVPSCLNFFTMWFIRLPLAFMMASTLGLQGVWIAMAIELSCRGLIFLGRLYRKYGPSSPAIVTAT